MGGGLRRVARGARHPTDTDTVGVQVNPTASPQDVLPLWLLEH